MNGKWVTSGGNTLQTTKFGGFVPVGGTATGQSSDPNDKMRGDIIEIRVG